jgi:integrase
MQRAAKPRRLLRVAGGIPSRGDRTRIDQRERFRPMASIYKRRGRPHYRISYFDHQGKRQDISSGTTDKRAAERIAAKFEADVALRRSGVVDAEQSRLAEEGRKPLAVHIADHLRHVELAERAGHTLKSRSRDLRWLQSETGATRLSELTAEGFERARARLRAAGRSAMTANHRQESAQAFLNWCVRTGRLASNPLRVLSKLNGDADRRYLRRPLTEDELRRLFDVAQAHGRFAFYAMAFYAGMRRGELGRLRWGDADLEAKTLTVRRGKAKRTDVVPTLA